MNFTFVLSIAVLIALSGCSHPATSGDVSASPDGALAPAAMVEGVEEDVPLDQVPDDILDAAEAAVPGATFSTAERELEDGVVVYDIEGTVDGAAVEVEVSESGVVLEIEHGDDDDDDDDDDDGDDDSS